MCVFGGGGGGAGEGGADDMQVWGGWPLSMC